MVNLTRRSNQKEFLDRIDIPFEDIATNMKELNFINTYLGGHAITLRGINDLISRQPSRKEDLLICEIGCGGGDNLQVVANWARKNNIHVRTIGIDINPDCIAYASSNFPGAEAEWISSDFRFVSFDEPPDIVFNSLFCHHFSDEEMIEVLNWMHKHSRIGFFINDLHRHSLAFYSIKFLTRLFSKSYLVKNDAPLSVMRGFKKHELEDYLKQAGIPYYDIQWKWAFRWLVTSNKS